jgi:hypothetical protein
LKVKKLSQSNSLDRLPKTKGRGTDLFLFNICLTGTSVTTTSLFFFGSQRKVEE